MYSMIYEEAPRYSFNHETWHVTGDVEVKALMEKFGFEYADEFLLVEDLYLQLADNVFELNKEVYYENIKMKLIDYYPEEEYNAKSCYLVKIVE